MLRQNKHAVPSVKPKLKVSYENTSSNNESVSSFFDRFSFASVSDTLSSWFNKLKNANHIHSFLSQDGNTSDTSNADQTISQSKEDEKPKSQGVNYVTDFQHAAYFSAAFLFIYAISSFSSVRTVRRGVLLGLGGVILAIFASFFTQTWDLGDSLRWLVSFTIGAGAGLFFSHRTKPSQFGQSACVLQAAIGLASFLLGFAQYERYEFFREELEGFVKLETVFVCLLGSTLFSSALTLYSKLDKKNLAKKPLETIGKKRDIINTIILVSIGVLAVIYIIFNSGWALFSIVVLSLYIGWGLTISVHPREMNVILPYETVLTGLTMTFAGFMLDRHYLMIVGALCITGGYKLLSESQKALNTTVTSIFFKSWAKEVSESVTSNLEAFGYTNQLISDSDLASELILSDNILIVPGNGLYQTEATQAISEVSAALRQLNKNVIFCIHPAAGRIPGHLEAILASEDIPYNTIKQMEKVDCSDFDLAVVIGGFEEVDPEKERSQPTCRVWEATKVIYVETRIEKYQSNGLFDKQNVAVVKGDTKKILANVIRDFQRKGFVDMQPEERNLYINGQNAGLPPVAATGQAELQTLVEKATKVLGVLNETNEGRKESRVAVTPSLVKPLLKNGVHVWIEKSAGHASGFSDQDYLVAGAKVTSANEIFSTATIQVFVSELSDKNANLVSKNTELLIAPISTQHTKQTISKLIQNDKLSVLDLSAVPVSQNTVKSSKFNARANQTILSGYRSVFEGFYYLNKVARPLFNAAGRSPAAQVLVIGADQSGLNLGSIAKQYGANVRVFDKRDSLKHSIKKHGFTAVEFVYEILDKNPNQMEEVQQKALAEALTLTDLVLIPANANSDGVAHRVLNEQLISQLRHGAVIVDLGAEIGGSTSLTQVDKVNYDNNTGVTVIGYTQSTYCQKLNRQASELYSFNVNNLFNTILQSNPIEDSSQPVLANLDNECIKEICWIFQGHDVSETRLQGARSEMIETGIANEEDIPEEASQALQQTNNDPNVNVISIQNSETSSIAPEYPHPGKEQGENSNERPSFKERVSQTLKKADQIYQDQKSKAAVLIADSLGEKQEETINKNPGVFTTIVMVIVFLICVIIAGQTNQAFIFMIGLFILALFVGSTVVNQVDKGLNAPLLLFLQTLSGSLGVACMLVFQTGEDNDLFNWYSFIAGLGNIFAIACLVGGFSLTLASVNDFTPKEFKQVVVDE